MLYYGKDVKKKYEALERAPNALSANIGNYSSPYFRIGKLRD
jgi:hypothetical protein